MSSNFIEIESASWLSNEEKEYFKSIGICDINNPQFEDPLESAAPQISDEEWREFCEGMDSGSAHRVYELEKHDRSMIFTRKGKKYSNMLRHMVNHGNAKSGKTMRQIYRYCYQYLFDKGWTQFYPPAFNVKCKYIVELGDDRCLYITNVTRNKRYHK